ncbi:MATE family efflux transporter [Granulicatella sp. HMSC31F03]|uniref:MATE family efflux transporter n=1 Tax=Granulicatella sp. HMSC31F03 TaxID=1581074 RepID=UPI0008A4BB97|nr:MATE family efflux transporter [Granulicatella sp. HMSC31F03]OFT01988.1 MATE family efflux transporter [Granulicatella sp. HMSC31F03]
MAKDMTSGKPIKLIWNFTIPLLIGNLFQQLYNMADTFIVGRTIGVHALASVGSTGSIIFLILGFANGLTAGLAIPLAQRYGAKNYSGVKRSFYVSILISAVVAILLTILSMVFCRQILEIMQTPVEIIDGAYDYLMVIFAGIFSSMAFNLLSNIFRSIGDAKTPLYFLVIACIMNIILDVVFIAGFGMGVEGAGYATVLSQIFSALACILYIWKKIPILRLNSKDFVAESSDVREHVRISFPMAFQSSIIAIGAIIIQITLNQLGATAVAAYTAAQKIDQVAILPMMSFGVTMATFVAQNYGAKKYDRIWRGVRDCIKLSLTFAISVGIILNLFSPIFIRAFVGVGHEEVVELGAIYFITNGTMYSLLSLLFIYRYTLQGVGKTFTPTIAGIMELCMRAFAAVVLSNLYGYTGATMANPLAWLGSLIPLMIAYYLFKNKFPKEQSI